MRRAQIQLSGLDLLPSDRCINLKSRSEGNLTGRLSRGAAGTRPKRRRPSKKLPARRGSSLITRNDCPSSCQSNVVPDLILNRSRRAFGTTVCPLLVTVLVMVRISFMQPDLASPKRAGPLMAIADVLCRGGTTPPARHPSRIRDGGLHGGIEWLQGQIDPVLQQWQEKETAKLCKYRQ